MKRDFGSLDDEPTTRRASPLVFAPDPEVLSANRIVGFEQTSAQVQPFFVLRSQLLRHVKNSGHQVFAITSVEAGNGKTHVAANLAAAMSRIQPTVLIELDLRWPSLGERFGMTVASGIDDYLAGDTAHREAAIRIKEFDLTVCPARCRRSDVEDLLRSPRLGGLVQDFRTAANRPIILIDTPPALFSDDLALILRVVDGVLIVVQEAKTCRRDLESTISSINPIPIVGSILNMSISSPSSKIDYGYYDRLRHRAGAQ